MPSQNKYKIIKKMSRLTKSKKTFYFKKKSATFHPNLITDEFSCKKLQRDDGETSEESGS